MDRALRVVPVPDLVRAVTAPVATAARVPRALARAARVLRVGPVPDLAQAAARVRTPA